MNFQNKTHTYDLFKYVGNNKNDNIRELNDNSNIFNKNFDYNLTDLAKN